MTPPCHIPVIPAEAGIHVAELNRDPRFRGDDGWGYQRFCGDDGARGDDGTMTREEP